MRKSHQPKPKKVAYELIDSESVAGHPLYVLLCELIAAHHQELEKARIALAWCTSWQPDVDGRVKLGQCRRASDLDRTLAPYDFVILLRRAFWLDMRVSDAQRTALLDHELTHATVKLDRHGDPAVDDRGRIGYRIRKHDIEEFTEIVARHGCYKADLERFAMALRTKGVPEFTPCPTCQDTPGWMLVADASGTPRATRCACFVEWQHQRQLGKSA